MGINKGNFFITFSLFNISFGYVSCHNLIMFFFHFCNKILLNFYVALVMFLFSFFLFHNLDLGLDLFLFSFWFKKSHKLH
jgi:hypothetical protein